MLLKRKSQGAEVKQLQEKLGLEADGVFRTRNRSKSKRMAGS